MLEQHILFRGALTCRLQHRKVHAPRNGCECDVRTEIFKTGVNLATQCRCMYPDGLTLSRESCVTSFGHGFMTVAPARSGPGVLNRTFADGASVSTPFSGSTPERAKMVKSMCEDYVRG